MVFLLFFVAAATQLYCWSEVFSRAWAKPETLPVAGSPAPPVTVIICFHNEAETIEACLTGLLEQTYEGDYEILAVDDNSTDDSAALVREFTARHPQLRYLQPGTTRPGKKDALAYGIEQAQHELLLLTDADCRPAGLEWLERMTQPLRAGRELVLGFSPYAPTMVPSWLNDWQRFEAVYVATKYLSFARRGWPYMGVGRNLAYRKSFFTRAGGFTAHAALASGDDDLLVGRHAVAKTTAVMVEPGAWTWSAPHRSWRAYWRQRRRHQSTGGLYPGVCGGALGGIALSHGLFFLLGFYLLFTQAVFFGLVLYALRLLLVFNAYHQPFLGAAAGAGLSLSKPVKKGYKRKLKSAFQLIIFDAMLGPMYLFLAISSLFPSRRW